MDELPIDALWLTGASSISLAELVAASGLSEAEIIELREYGVLPAVGGEATEVRFGTQCILLARTARRLQEDFELSPPATALALTLLARIEALESELSELRCRLPR